MVRCRMVFSRNVSFYFLRALGGPQGQILPFSAAVPDFIPSLSSSFTKTNLFIFPGTHTAWWLPPTLMNLEVEDHTRLSDGCRLRGGDAVTDHYVVSCLLRKLQATVIVFRQTNIIFNGLLQKIALQLKRTLAEFPKRATRKTSVNWSLGRLKTKGHYTEDGIQIATIFNGTSLSLTFWSNLGVVICAGCHLWIQMIV